MANIDSKINRLFGITLLFIILFTWFTLFFYTRAQYDVSGAYLDQLKADQQRQEDQQKRFIQYQHSKTVRR